MKRTSTTSAYSHPLPLKLLSCFVSAVLALSLVPAAAFADSAAGEGAQPAAAETGASASNDAATGGESGSAGGAEGPGADAGSAEGVSSPAGAGSTDGVKGETPSTDAEAASEGGASASAGGVLQPGDAQASADGEESDAESAIAVQEDAEESKLKTAADGDGITLPGNYASRGVTIDGVAFHVLYVDKASNKALLLTKDVQYQAAFDTNNSSSWKASSTRTYLNSTWLQGKSQLSANVVETDISTRNDY